MPSQDLLSAFEDRLSAEEFRENTPHGPNVDGSGLCLDQHTKQGLVMETHVVGEAQHDFRSAVPSRGHVFRHEALVSGRLGSATTRRKASRETKITNLEFTVGVYEEVSRLKIPMQYVCRVDIL